MPKFERKVRLFIAFSSFSLLILLPRFPKTYPTLSHAIFTIQKPAQGLNNEQIAKLGHEIHREAQAHRGSVMVMDVRRAQLFVYVSS